MTSVKELRLMKVADLMGMLINAQNRCVAANLYWFPGEPAVELVVSHMMGPSQTVMFCWAGNFEKVHPYELARFMNKAWEPAVRAAIERGMKPQKYRRQCPVNRAVGANRL